MNSKSVSMVYLMSILDAGFSLAEHVHYRNVIAVFLILVSYAFQGSQIRVRQAPDAVPKGYVFAVNRCRKISASRSLYLHVVRMTDLDH